MIFAVEPYLCVPYRPFAGHAAKNDAILAECQRHPERFLLSHIGDPRIAVARALTNLDNAAWEVWQSDTFIGILLLDRIEVGVDARLQFVFFDDELASKSALLTSFVDRCFAEWGFHRLTFEAPANMTTLLSFAQRKLGFTREGERAHACFDGERWRDMTTLGRVHGV